jgi:LmbE family N-acetylglucosaminyl deacetylase
MKYLSPLIFLLLVLPSTYAQRRLEFHPASSSEIQHKLQKLNVLGSVLYVAAHPDDENTRLIAWLANDQKLETSYVSLTRGDGGQNLIGSERGEQIGILRTQELLEARGIDKAHQYFTRAVDFGYSKTVKETFEIWNREEVLSDLVYVIRKTRPDIIICRFPENATSGHGHHTASALLAREAYQKAFDPKHFPEHLPYVTAWRPKKIYLNTSSWWDKTLEERWSTDESITRINVGTYNALLGEWHNELAMKARSKHRSQGFGTLLQRGELFEYLQLLEAYRGGCEPTDGIDLTWNRVTKSENIQQQINRLIDGFQPNNPSASLNGLAQLYRILEDYPWANYWVEKKKEEVAELILDCGAVYVEAIADKPFTAPGGQVKVNINMVSDAASGVVQIDSVLVADQLQYPYTLLGRNKPIQLQTDITIPKDGIISQPFWLRKPYKGLFATDDIRLRCLPENPPALEAYIVFETDGIRFSKRFPVLYKWRDRVTGENMAYFHIRPAITLQSTEQTLVFLKAGEERTLTVSVTAHKDEITGTLRLRVPDKWEIEPKSQQITMNKQGETRHYTFRITPREGAVSGQLFPYDNSGTGDYDRALVEIDYPHIHKQTIFPIASVKLVYAPLTCYAKKVGYIMGPGDEVPASIAQMGAEVIMLYAAELPSAPLADCDAIVLGIRALNTEDGLKKNYNLLMDYVKNGGLLIVQYNTPDLMFTDIGPYPFKISRNRVTDEKANPEFTDAQHDIFNIPNPISQSDFQDWVQERGLYFAGEITPNYSSLISWKDPGEEPAAGALICADYGKGKFVYTGISFFRQLPAGVAGAYRLWANILSYGRKP